MTLEDVLELKLGLGWTERGLTGLEDVEESGSASDAIMNNLCVCLCEIQNKSLIFTFSRLVRRRPLRIFFHAPIRVD